MNLNSTPASFLKKLILILYLLPLTGCYSCSEPDKSYRYYIRRAYRTIVLDVRKDGGGFAYDAKEDGSPIKSPTGDVNDLFQPGDVVYKDAGPLRSAASRAATANPISRSNTFFGLTQDGKLLQFETTNLSVVRSLKVGESLRAGAIAPLNQTLYLASWNTDFSTVRNTSVKVVNMETFTLTASMQLPVDALPLSIAVSPDGAYVYVPSAVNSPMNEFRLYIFETTRNTLITTLTFPGAQTKAQIKFSPDGGLAFVGIKTGVAVIDTATLELSQTITPRLLSELHIEVDPTGTRLYLAPVYGPFVTNPAPPPVLTSLPGVDVYDISTLTLMKHIPVKNLSTTMAMALSSDGGILAINHIAPDPVTLRNGPPVLKTIDVGTGQVLTESRSLQTDLTVKCLILLP